MNSISADQIGLAETLEMMDEHLAPLVKALCDREFALWIGSGISFGKAPSLRELVEAVIEFVRGKSDSSNLADPHYRTLRRILGDHAKLSAAEVDAQPFTTPFSAWPDHAQIVETLRNNYSPMLDERVTGQKSDYLLWEGVDVVARFAGLNDPDAEHYAIAILVLEGAVTDIASGNWDGLIEAAIERLSPTGIGGTLHMVVEPGDARAHGSSATLIKFHGCAICCAKDEDRFRPYLIATEAKMVEWANAEGPVQAAIRGIATNSRALVVGLSLQDGNLKDVFEKARRINPWGLPVPPEPPAHVFCEEIIGPGQRTVLNLVYGAGYDENPDLVIDSALLRARPKTALPALAIFVICDKLTGLALAGAQHFTPDDKEALASGISALRTLVGSAAPADRDAFADYFRTCIAAWSHCLSLFRTGMPLAAGAQHYHAISPNCRSQMLADPNVSAAGLLQFGAAAAMLGNLVNEGTLSTSAPTNEYSACNTIGHHARARARPVTFVGSSGAALKLMSNGVFNNPDAIVIHSDGAVIQALAGTGRSPSGAKRSPATHIGIAQLLEEADSYAKFRERFLEEAGI